MMHISHIHHGKKHNQCCNCDNVTYVLIFTDYHVATTQLQIKYKLVQIHHDLPSPQDDA